VSGRLDREGNLKQMEARMNTKTMQQHLLGPGPFLIRTSDGKQYSVPHGEFVGFTKHYVMIEDASGVLDIVDPVHVVSVRPVAKRRARAA
jgi:hypothetical protein